MAIVACTTLGYNTGVKKERFDFEIEPSGFRWFAKPLDFSFGNGLEIHTTRNTDFWQRTFYGFRRDSGHAYLLRVDEDFTMTTRVSFEPNSQYDQCGVFIRTDAANWIKASIEYEGEEPAHLGSVVTTLGYSDWAWQPIDRSIQSISYRVNKRESDVLLEWSNNDSWNAMRIAHLHAQGDEVEAGIYACSPVGDGFTCRFEYLEIGPCGWSAASE